MCSENKKELIEFINSQKQLLIDKIENRNRIEPIAIGKTIMYDVILVEAWEREGFKIEYDKNGFVVGGKYYWYGFKEGGELDLSEKEAVMVADYFRLPI